MSEGVACLSIAGRVWPASGSCLAKARTDRSGNAIGAGMTRRRGDQRSVARLLTDDWRSDVDSTVRQPPSGTSVHNERVTNSVLSAVWEGLVTQVPLLTVVAVVFVLLASPPPGRGPRKSAGRDPWRGYRLGSRDSVVHRADGRCEAAAFVAWGRCAQAATQVDHVYPWSRGGPTIISNGQALCRDHNRRKSNLRPPWWYVLALERRRRGYFPPGVDVRVHSHMNAGERAARLTRPGRGDR
jgi:hypothetical protein